MDDNIIIKKLLSIIFYYIYIYLGNIYLNKLNVNIRLFLK